MVGEEVRVRRRRQHGGRPPPEAVDAEVEAAEGLADVRADRRVHESRVERHPGHLGERVLGIGPRPDPHLEQLQREPDQVEPEDHRHLAGRLQPEQEEDRREDQGVREQGVVARERERLRALELAVLG